VIERERGKTEMRKSFRSTLNATDYLLELLMGEDIWRKERRRSRRSFLVRSVCSVSGQSGCFVQSGNVCAQKMPEERTGIGMVFDITSSSIVRFEPCLKLSTKLCFGTSQVLAKYTQCAKDCGPDNRERTLPSVFHGSSRILTFEHYFFLNFYMCT
jgi:hypothetical protein